MVLLMWLSFFFLLLDPGWLHTYRVARHLKWILLRTGITGGAQLDTLFLVVVIGYEAKFPMLCVFFLPGGHTGRTRKEKTQKHVSINKPIH